MQMSAKSTWRVVLEHNIAKHTTSCWVFSDLLSSKGILFICNMFEHVENGFPAELYA